MSATTQIFEPTNSAIVDDIKTELRLQGHYLTGALEASLKEKEISVAGAIILSAESLHYLEDLENFTPPDKINVSFEDYQKIKNWVLLRGMADDDVGAGKVAQQIITKWKKTGRPGPGSAEFSETGTRTDAVKESFAKNEEKYTDMLDTAAIGGLDKDFSSIKSGTI